jgi:hypothetical protein
MAVYCNNHTGNILLNQSVDNSSDVWTLSTSDENTLAVWERKIKRKLFSPVNENGVWRIRTLQEMMDLYRE